MNFFRKYIGDFQRDTRRLTLLEKGAYNELLDLLYASEHPLPLDHRELYRATGCESSSDRKAIDRIIIDFFEKTDNGYTQKRAMIEIEKAADRRSINRQNGSKGGRPNKTKSDTESVSNDITESQSKDESYPVTSNHYPLTIKNTGSSESAESSLHVPSTKTPMTLEWRPEPELLRAACQRSGITADLITPYVLVEFTAYWSSESAVFTQAQWMQKLINAARRYAAQPKPVQPVPDLTPPDPDKPSQWAIEMSAKLAAKEQAR